MARLHRPSQLILPIAAVLTALDLATRNLPSIWLMLAHVKLEIGAMGEGPMAHSAHRARFVGADHVISGI